VVVREKAELPREGNDLLFAAEDEREDMFEWTTRFGLDDSGRQF
jgi:hypothetical protein